MTRGALVTAASGLALLVACAPEPGLARVLFVVAEGTALDEDASLVLRVEDAAGVDLAASAPRFIPRGPLVDVEVPRIAIPHGEHRVAILELRAVDDDALLFFGRSRPFSLAPDDDIDVPIDVALRARPSVTAAVVGVVDRRAPAALIQLAVRSDRGERIEVSNLVDFAAEHAGSFPMAPLVEWDVDRGLALACVDDDACARKVFVRVRDATDHPSRIVELDLTVDTRAPRVEAGSLSMDVESALPWLREPTQLRAGAGVRVTFVASEPLVQVQLMGGDQVAFEPCRATGIAVVCDGRASTSTTAAREPLRAALVDRVGHAAQVDLGIVEVVGAPPAPPVVSRVVFERAPWGRADLPGDEVFRVVGSAGAVPAGATVVAFVDASTDRVEVARTGTPAADDGSFELRLPTLPADRASVGLVVVDAAGQPSDASPSPGVQATLTERGMVVIRAAHPGAPVVLERSPDAAPILFSPHRTRVEPAERVVLDRADGRALEVTSAAWWAQHLPTAALPAPVYGARMAFDRARGEWVMFGGESNVVVSDATWLSDGGPWRRVEGAPPARRGHGMVYDASRREVLLFGGASEDADVLDAPWVWDGERWEEGAVELPGRLDHAMAYDRARGEVVVFGGQLAGGADALDTCVRRPTGWSCAQLPSPSPRTRASMTFDPTSGTVLMFGGGDREQSFDELWSWNGASWSLLANTGTAAPPARLDAGWVFVPELGGVLLFGGRSTNVGPEPGASGFEALDDAWLWKDGGWRQLGALPFEARIGPAVAEADFEGRVRLFGGRPQVVFDSGLDDGWTWRAGGWSRDVATLDWPAARERAASAFDPERGAMLIAGGSRMVGWRSDAWWWDGRGWSRAIDVPPLYYPMLAWDAARAVMVLFGSAEVGDNSFEAEVWERVSGVWILRDRSRPAAFLGVAAYFPAASGVAVWSLDGRESSTSASRTRLWTGAWSSYPVAGTPPARAGQAWVASPLGDALWSVGGLDAAGTAVPRRVERLTSGGWGAPLRPTARPPERSFHGLVVDPRWGDRVLAGGGGTSAWTLDPSSLDAAELPVASRGPTARDSPALVAAHDTVWMFGGLVLAQLNMTSELWSLERTADARGALVVGVTWRALGFEAAATSAVEVHAVAGGTAAPGAAGVELEAWDPIEGAWVAAGSSDGGSSAPSVVEGSLPAPARLLDGRGALHLRVSPRGVLVGGPSRLALDALEVTLRYGPIVP